MRRRAEAPRAEDRRGRTFRRRLSRGLHGGFLFWVAVCAACVPQAHGRRGGSVAGVEIDSHHLTTGATVRSVALRVHQLDRMIDFYREAFGVRFRSVDTFGVASRFGDLGGITLKLVPIRDDVDFVGYPDLQLGIEVDDIESIVAIARRHGGRQEGETRREADLLHASVRDPDGNTLELYQPIRDGSP